MKQYLIGLSVPIWLLTCAGFYKPLMDYENRAGVSARSQDVFPEKSHLQTIPEKNTVVVFLHPQCPCSHATLSELAVLMSKHADDSLAYAVFIKPAGVDEDWVKTSLFNEAKAIPGVQTVIDGNGDETKLFGSKTSGQILVYDKKRHLDYAGGITANRGHAGDNTGLDAAVCSLNDQKNVPSKEVFGCALFSKDGAR